MTEKPLLKKLLPLLLTAFVILADQLTKVLVVKYIPLYSLFNDNSIIPVFGDIVRLIHVRNKAVAFSIGSSLPSETRRILFSFIPLVIIAFVFVFYFKNNESGHGVFLQKKYNKPAVWFSYKFKFPYTTLASQFISGNES